MIFVTGGTGLLGNSIIRELCQRGVPVRALCRSGTDRKPFDGLDVEIVEGDLSDLHILTSAIQGCEAVIHCAAMIHVGWTKLELAREVNVEGTRRITQACKSADCRLVYVTTVDTFQAAVSTDAPLNEASTGGISKTRCNYVISKMEAEQVVEDAIKSEQLNAVIVHPGFMLGPYDWKPSSGRMMVEVTKSPVVFAPPGGCSLCDARDVAAGAVNAIEAARSGEHYILAGENVSYQQLFQRMLQTAGKRKRAFRFGPAIRLVGNVIDLANRCLPIKEGDVNGAAIQMGCQFHCYDSGKAERELGYVRRSSDETLADAWEWLSARSK